jgi:Nucleotidyl transferase AbiEii toxin, Type IV TA system
VTEAFLELSPDDRLDALAVASAASARPLHLLEKDVWVVWALQTLFGSAIGANLVFKGGTYGVIRRFSEDVDLTLDMRALAPDLIADGVDGLPATRSQERKWSKELKVRLADRVQADALPMIAEALSKVTVPATATADGDRIYIDYDPLATGTGYVSPRVMLEFGARSTGEPWEEHDILCDAAEHLPQLSFPTARPRVMMIERTFWEKATAIHVFCAQGRLRGAERVARH